MFKNPNNTPGVGRLKVLVGQISNLKMFAGRSPSFSFCSSFQTSEYLYYFRISRKFYLRPFFFFCSSLQNSGISSVSFQFRSTCSGAAILRFGAAELPFEGRIPLKIKRCSGAADLPFEGRSGPRGHVLPTPVLER